VVLDFGAECPPYLEGLPFLTFPVASARPPTLPVELDLAPFFRLFSVFFASEDSLKKRSLQKHFFFALFAPLWPPGVDFRQFLVPKSGPGAWIFRLFCKIAVFLKLHPLLGNNTIFRVQTSQNRPAECFRASMRQKIDKNR